MDAVADVRPVTLAKRRLEDEFVFVWQRRLDTRIRAAGLAFLPWRMHEERVFIHAAAGHACDFTMRTDFRHVERLFFTAAFDADSRAWLEVFHKAIIDDFMYEIAGERAIPDIFHLA